MFLAPISSTHPFSTTKAATKPVDPNAARQNLALEQQRHPAFWAKPLIEEQLRSVEISIQQARLNGAEYHARRIKSALSGIPHSLRWRGYLESAELGLVSAGDLNAQKQREMQAFDEGTQHERASSGSGSSARKYRDIADRAQSPATYTPELKSWKYPCPIRARWSMAHRISLSDLSGIQ